MFRFPCKPKHVGAVLLILKCFNSSMFFDVVCISWKLKCWILLMHGVTMKLIHNHVHKNLPFDPFISYFPKIHFNIILMCTGMCVISRMTFRFSALNFKFPYSCYVSRLYHSSFIEPNRPYWTINKAMTHQSYANYETWLKNKFSKWMTT